MALRITTIQRYEIDSIPSDNLKRHLANMEPEDRKAIKRCARDLSESSIKNFGEITALEVLWAIGLLFEREDYSG